MEINERMIQMVSKLAKSLLWEVVSADVDNTTHLPTMLDGIGYVNHELIQQVNHCELLETTSFDVVDIEPKDNKLFVSFEMPFILMASNNSTPLLRITAVAEGTCVIPDMNSYDWESKDFSAMNKTELLAHHELVEMEELYYSEVECDEQAVK